MGLTASHRGDNAFNHFCDKTSRRMSYFLCLSIITAFKRHKGNLTAYTDCAACIAGKTCPALKMAVRERKAGKALYFQERAKPKERLLVARRELKPRLPAWLMNLRWYVKQEMNLSSEEVDEALQIPEFLKRPVHPERQAYLDTLPKGPVTDLAKAIAEHPYTNIEPKPTHWPPEEFGPGARDGDGRLPPPPGPGIGEKRRRTTEKSEKSAETAKPDLKRALEKEAPNKMAKAVSVGGKGEGMSLMERARRMRAEAKSK